MPSAKMILLAAGCCLALLGACQRTDLPATTTPLMTTSTTMASTISAPPPSIEEAITGETSALPPTTEEETTTATEPITTTPPPTETEPVTTTPPPTETPPATTSSPPPTGIQPATTASPPTPTETQPSTTTEPATDTTPVTTTAPATEPATALPPPSLDLSRAEEAFQLQNQLMSQHDTPPLLWSESLYQLAAKRAQEIPSDYSHNGCPDWVAENILMGTNRPDLAIQIWYDSPGHQRNMLAGWTYGAVANYGYYWVAIYAMTETP